MSVTSPSSSNTAFVDFVSLRHAVRFKATGLRVLLSTFSRFFGCKIVFSDTPSTLANTALGIDIDIKANLRRGCYLIDDRTAVVLGRVIENRITISAFSLTMSDGSFARMGRVLNAFERSLARALSTAYARKFRFQAEDFGEQLVKRTVGAYFAMGRYGPGPVEHVINTFVKLASTTFEGRNFTTGLIMTRSHYAYAGRGVNPRPGTILQLTKPVKLEPGKELDKRFWFLADGQGSYFLCGRSLTVFSVFLSSEARPRPNSFIADYTLSDTLRGGDALFRVTSRSECSITLPDGLEFNYKESSWRARHLSDFGLIIRRRLQLNDTVIGSLLYHVMQLAKRRLSSIIWIPDSLWCVRKRLLTRNRFSRARASITRPSDVPLVTRMLSSDGATVIAHDGDVLYYGCLVDVSRAKSAGIRGTGESVARLLSERGVAVKISQDGIVKLFVDATLPPIVF